MTRRESVHKAIFTLFLMLLIPASAWTGFRLLPQWSGFAVSGAGTVLALVSYFAGRGRIIGYLLCALLNSLGTGCAIGAFYHYQTPFPDTKELCLVAGIWIVFLLLFLLGMYWKASLWLTGIAFFLWLAGIVVSVVYWCMGAGAWYSFSFYIGLSAGFWSAAVYADTMVKDDSGNESVWKIFAIFSYGVYLLIVLIIALVLSEGDCCDIDCCCDSGADCGSYPNQPNKKAKHSAKPPV